MSELSYVGFRFEFEKNSEDNLDETKQSGYGIVIARTKEEALSILYQHISASHSKVNLIDCGLRVLMQARVLGLRDGEGLVL